MTIAMPNPGQIKNTQQSSISAHFAAFAGKVARIEHLSDDELNEILDEIEECAHGLHRQQRNRGEL